MIEDSHIGKTIKASFARVLEKEQLRARSLEEIS